MAIPPHYGQGITANDLNTQIPTAVLYGVTPANTFMPIKILSDGSLSIGSVTISGPVTINDVVIKGVDPENSNYPQDVAVANFGTTGFALHTAIFDGDNHLLVNADGSINCNATVNFGATDVGLKNIAQVPINPATEDTLASILAQLDTPLSTRTKPSDTQLVDGSAHTQPVSGTFWQAIQPISGSVSVAGTVTVTNFPATQPVSGTVSAVQSGSWTVVLGTSGNHIGLADQGTPASLANAWPIKPTDGTNSQIFLATGEGKVAVTQPLPTGSNGIGSVTVSSGTIAISNFPATQPISAVALPLPTGAATEATLAAAKTDLDKFTFIATRLLVDGSGVVQPISASSLPLPTGAATETTLAAIKVDADKFTFASTRLLTDGSGVIQPVSGTVNAVQSGTWTVTLASGSIEIGTVDQGTPASIANSWPVEVTDGTNILGTPAHPFRVDPTGTTTQPVSAASLPLPAGAATAGNQTSGAQKTQIVDGSNTTITSTLTSGKQGLDVNISGGITLSAGRLVVDGSGVVQPVSGSVSISNFPAVQTVSVNNLPSIQPVSQSGTWTVSLSTESIEIGTVDQGTAGTLANGWPVKLSDGTNLLGVTAHPVRTDPTGTTKQPISISQTSTDNNVDVVDRTARELGRVLASDLTIASETFSTTSNVYGNARPVQGDIDVRHFKTKKIFVKNTSASNNGRIQIFGSVDGGVTFDVTVVADTALANGNTSITDLTDALTHIQIQARSQTNGQTTTFVSKGYALGI